MKNKTSTLIKFNIPSFNDIITEKNFGEKVCEALEQNIVKITHLINELNISTRDFYDFLTWYNEDLKEYIYDKIELNKAIRERTQLDSWYVSENAKLQELHYKIICSDNDRDILSNKPINNVQNVEIILPDFEDED